MKRFLLKIAGCLIVSTGLSLVIFADARIPPLSPQTAAPGAWAKYEANGWEWGASSAYAQVGGYVRTSGGSISYINVLGQETVGGTLTANGALNIRNNTAGTIFQVGSVGAQVLGINAQANTMTISNTSLSFNGDITTVNAGSAWSMNSPITFDFLDGSATPGSATSNHITGTNALAVASASITITNSFATATSTILGIPQTSDAVCMLKSIIPAAGSFTINMSGACSATTKVTWAVFPH